MNSHDRRKRRGRRMGEKKKKKKKEEEEEEEEKKKKKKKKKKKNNNNNNNNNKTATTTRARRTRRRGNIWQSVVADVANFERNEIKQPWPGCDASSCMKRIGSQPSQQGETCNCADQRESFRLPFSICRNLRESSDHFRCTFVDIFFPVEVEIYGKRNRGTNSGLCQTDCCGNFNRALERK